MIRLLDTKQVPRAPVDHQPDYDRDLVLLTNIPVCTAAEAKAMNTPWRCRSQIEHAYRFDQEDGLDAKEMCV